MIKIVTVYIDVLYFLHFFTNVFVFAFAKKIMTQRGMPVNEIEEEKDGTGIRIVIGAVILAAISCVCEVVFSKERWVGLGASLVFFSLFIIWMYGVKSFRGFLYAGTYVFITMTLLNGGIYFLKCMLGQSKVPYLSVVAMGGIAFLYLLFGKGYHMMKEFSLHKSQNAYVTIKVAGKEAKCKGFWDSGNKLKDPITGRAVVLLEKAVMEENKIPIPIKGFRVIPYNSVGMKNGVLKGFVADELVIMDEEGMQRRVKKAVVAIYEGTLSVTHDYQMILNYGL